jgi:hypothetical protein
VILPFLNDNEVIPLMIRAVIDKNIGHTCLDQDQNNISRLRLPMDVFTPNFDREVSEQMHAKKS